MGCPFQAKTPIPSKGPTLPHANQHVSLQKVIGTDFGNSWPQRKGHNGNKTFNKYEKLGKRSGDQVHSSLHPRGLLVEDADLPKKVKEIKEAKETGSGKSNISAAKDRQTPSSRNELSEKSKFIF